MVRLIILTILLIVIVRILWRFTRAIFEGAGMLRDPEERTAVKLVRDPVCGIFVSPSRALTAGSGSSVRYFCSEECRKEWSRR